MMYQYTSSIVFTYEVDATAAFKSCELIPIHGEIVVVSYPNQFLQVGDKSDEYIAALMK